MSIKASDLDEYTQTFVVIFYLHNELWNIHRVAMIISISSILYSFEIGLKPWKTFLYLVTAVFAYQARPDAPQLHFLVRLKLCQPRTCNKCVKLLIDNNQRRKTTFKMCFALSKMIDCCEEHMFNHGGLFWKILRVENKL